MREYFPSPIRRPAGVQVMRKGVDFLIDMFCSFEGSVMMAARCVLYFLYVFCQTRRTLRDAVSLVTYDHSEECFLDRNLSAR